ncbi:methionyl-tRNA formyltransferase [Altibacter sp. HG106]|uniref:methionyl-tRNA formyltransferase n=1 Tax=Altibacter sp. HG106 TaxID=3023937 RepID=UPI0023504E5D|nr:methionyl-tRNA formyltransferase [Altibacter sp. HG106]MDC7993714.1 methionyl-tRNA formyltransferase [Altibacter sp. HG106]
MNTPLRIVFMGTPEFAVASLQQLVASEHEVVGVITAPDRPAGRGRKLRASAVKEYAVTQRIPVLQPTNLKEEAFLETLEALKADVQVVVAFRMLPKVVWAMPPKGTFNLHASLLPQYRGAAPINWAVINREKKSGVTTFFIDEKIDTGAIIASEEITLKEKETAGSLHDTLMEVGAHLVLRTVNRIATGTASATTQNPNQPLRSAPKLSAENTRIDWTQQGEQVEALIRGLSPYPSAWTELHNGEETLTMKLHSAQFEPSEVQATPGQIIADKKSLHIIVPNGVLQVEELQLPGKRKMKAGDLLNGFTFEKDAYVL